MKAFSPISKGVFDDNPSASRVVRRSKTGPVRFVSTRRRVHCASGSPVVLVAIAGRQLHASATG